MTRVHVHSVLWSLVLVSACGTDNNLYDQNDPKNPFENERSPCIVVSPSSVSFASIEVGVDPSITEVITVTNECENDEEEAGPLEIYEVELDDDDMPFDLGSIGSPLLTEGDSTTFTVTFDPQSDDVYTTSIFIESNDEDDPVVEVVLTGTGIAPVIEVSPEEYDFGSPYIGCAQEAAYTVSNVGTADLEVYGLDLATGSTEFDLSYDEDATTTDTVLYNIGSGGSVDVYLEYYPLDEYTDSAFLTVESNDPFTPEAVAQAEGEGTEYAETTDVFEQPLKSATDIAFSVDWSGSMYDDVANVGANFTTFINTLSGLEADYHVTGWIRDDGCVVGSDVYIDDTYSTSDAEDTFRTMLAIDSNGSGSGMYTESLFTIFEAGLAETGSGDCNDGFLRDDAKLSLVGVSDEPEQSINPYAYYISAFQAYKSDPDDVVVNAVAGDYPSGCGSAMAGTGYYEATVATGGLFLSICSTDFASHLESLAEESAAVNDSFELTQEPVPETIEVVVDGVTTSTGWEYDASTQSVVFETDYIPAGGSQLEITYMLMPDCDG